jgi:hypothetical protein
MHSADIQMPTHTRRGPSASCKGLLVSSLLLATACGDVQSNTSDSSVVDSSTTADSSTERDASNTDGGVDSLVEPPVGFERIASGNSHHCAFMLDGELRCWGSNGNHQCDVPEPSLGTRWVRVSSGLANTCAIASDGQLECWGGDFDGQSTPPDIGVFDPGAHWTDIDCGYFTCCGVTSAGKLACWGNNSSQQRTVPQLELGLSWRASSVGSGHACGIDSAGALHCWGANFSGEGDVPPLPNGTSWSRVECGHGVTCGISTDGFLQCWGSNSPSTLTVPTIPGSTSWTDLSVTEWVACGLRADGAAHCWGRSAANDAVLQPPGSVPQGDDRWVAVTASDSTVCAINAANSMVCRQIGGSVVRSTPTSTAISLQSSVRPSRFRGGEQIGCVSRTDGTTTCFGEAFNSPDLPVEHLDEVHARSTTFGICGRSSSGVACWGGSATATNLPPDGVQWARLVEAGVPFCGVSTGGSLYCWGEFVTSIPSLQSGWSPFTASTFAEIAPTARGVCATSAMGQLQCAGSSTPQIAVLPDGTSWAHVAAGTDAVCATDTNGGAWCWNWTTAASIPVPSLPTGATWSFVKVRSSAQMCGLHSTGSIVCWGSSAAAVPTLGSGVSWTNQLACGNGGCCALDSSGAVRCFGDAAFGTDILGPNVTSIQIPSEGGGGNSVCAIRGNGSVSCTHLPGQSESTFVLW